MPDRILRKDILDSERVNRLDAPSEVFYRRLMNIVDDHGLFDARPSLLRSACFPIRDSVRVTDISRWLAACQEAGLIVLYNSSGKSLGQMLDTKWPVRGKPKFDLPTSADKCSQPPTNVSVVVDVGEVVSVGVVEQEQGAPPAASPAKGIRLPADWTPDASLLAWATDKRPDLDLSEETAKFRDYWNAQPGAKGRKTDWPGTYRNWIRNAHAQRGARGSSQAMAPSRQFQALAGLQNLIEASHDEPGISDSPRLVHDGDC